ncbi:hypothetical protein PHYPSEUDO_010957 [Phytophthora pseudosyringae]|uniref:C1q domain-containing protein n=1 Tax=Phytophthora pseudosyringae TaxID=221518 RepID=A0A8T1W723_9STRA|nr:hypothetical protein PHYPSEUDO_010957 [Phytophthora pseudosyringae]
MSDAVKSDGAAEVATSAPVHPTAIPTAIPLNFPPSKTSPQEFLEFEGTTFFASSTSSTYRYSLSLKNGKLRIWLEDCESKKQWCTTELNIEDYVDSSNVIPDAIVSDYVECFRELLDTAKDDLSNIPSSFQRHQDGGFRLELAVKIQVLRKSRIATYTFDLETISVERIDVLESKLRDLQDEVEVLRSNDQEAASCQNAAIQKLDEGMKKLQRDVASRDAAVLQLKDEVKGLHLAQDNSVVIPLQATTKASGDLICWKNAAFIFGLNAIVTGLDGIVRVESPGTYQVMVVVNHQSANHNLSIKVMKGSECIQSAYCGYAQGNYASTSVMCTIRMGKTDQLTVKCPANLSGASYLTLVRLGE